MPSFLSWRSSALLVSVLLLCSCSSESGSVAALKDPTGSNYGGDIAFPVVVEWKAPFSAGAGASIAIPYTALSTIGGSELRVKFAAAAPVSLGGDAEKSVSGAIEPGTRVGGTLTVQAPVGRYQVLVTTELTTAGGLQSFTAPMQLTFGDPGPPPAPPKRKYSDDPAR